MSKIENNAPLRAVGLLVAAGRGRAVARALRRVALPLALVVTTNGCSQVPDALNPVEWYHGAADMLSGEDSAAADEPTPAEGTLAADRGEPPPGSDAPFPNLASVPERPEVDSAETRQQIADGLVADRQQARYSSEVIRRQGDDVAAAAPPPAPPVIATTEPPRPEPAAAPTAAAPPPLPQAAPAPPPAASAPPVAQPEPPPQRVAAMTPPPAPIARPAPALGNSVSEVFRSRVAEQNRLPSQLTAEAGGVGAATGGDHSTVVVSSGGVIVPSTPNVAGLDADSTVMPIGAAIPGAAAPLPAYGVVKVATIIFANGSSRLSSRDRNILADVIALHRQRGGVVHVVGHASSRTRTMDAQRHQAVNYQMSVARADAVAKALASMGVPRDAIRIDARSDGEPMYHEVMPTGEAGNRRAEIYLES